MKKIKIRCIDKQQDPVSKKTIYLLEDENGKRTTAKAEEIKQEIRAGAFDFINLQIDKAGRLVKKAEKLEQKISNEFTVEDLLNMREVKGKKIRAIDPDTKKIKHLIGNSYTINTNKNWGIHNSIYAYSEDEGKLYIVNIGSADGKNYTVNELSSGKYELALVTRFSYVVDLKENTNGRYTIISIGKYKERFIDQIFDMKAYKIHDKVENKDIWVNENFLQTHMDKSNGQNDFTNVYIKLDNIVVIGNVKNLDINYEMKLFQKYVDSIENIFKHDIEKNCLYMNFDEYTYIVSGDTIDKLESAKNMFDELNKVDLFNINNEKLHDIIMEILRDRISELTEVNNKKVYYIGIDGSELHMSTNENKIRKVYECYKSDSEFWGCNMDYIITNLVIK